MDRWSARIPTAKMLVGIGVLLAEMTNFDLVQCRLRVALSRFDNFERDKALPNDVPTKPNRGELAPSQFAKNIVAALLEHIADLDWLVAAFAVVLWVFLKSKHKHSVVCKVNHLPARPRNSN